MMSYKSSLIPKRKEAAALPARKKNRGVGSCGRKWDLNHACSQPAGFHTNVFVKCSESHFLNLTI